MSKRPFHINNIFGLPEPFLEYNVFMRGEGYYLPPHCHAFFHVNMVTDGMVDVITERERITVSQGQAFIMPPALIHSLVSDKGYSQIGMNIQDISEEYQLAERLHNLCRGRVVRVYAERERISEGYITEHMLTDMSSLSRLKCVSRMFSLLAELIEAGENQDASKIGANAAAFREKFLMVSRECCADNKSLEEICREMNFSKTHLERLVHREFGCSVKEYVNRLRFQKICSQLLLTDKPLALLAEENGFFDSSHLCVFFKKYSGITPKQYRMENGPSHSW